MSYDDAQGPYAGASVTIGPTRDEGVRVLRSVQYAGYVHRTTSGVALDAGITNRLYGRAATVEYARRFTQAYVGVIGRRASSHLFYAPDYDGDGGSAFYLQVDSLLFERGDWSLTGHAGALRPPRGERFGRTLEVDWRFGATRRLGRSSLSLSWVGGGPDEDEGETGRRWRGTIILSASRSF